MAVKSPARQHSALPQGRLTLRVYLLTLIVRSECVQFILMREAAKRPCLAHMQTCRRITGFLLCADLATQSLNDAGRLVNNLVISD
jgi:hypothetical protein